MKIIYEETNTYAEPVQSGEYPAVCYGFIDLGDQFGKYGWQTKLALLWEIMDDSGGMPQTVDKIYTFSLGRGSALRRDLSSWRDRDFTHEELSGGFDLTTVVGAPCMLTISNKQRTNGYVYTNVDAVKPLPVTMDAREPRRRRIIFDLDTDDLSLLDLVPPRFAKMIKTSPQYKARAGIPTDSAQTSGQTDVPSTMDDEVPF